MGSQVQILSARQLKPWWISFHQGFSSFSDKCLARPDPGPVADASVANWGTFIGAICFFLDSAIALPQLPWNRGAEADTTVA